MNDKSSTASVSRIVLFMILCAVLLAAVAPFARWLSAPSQLVVTGAATSMGTYALSVLFTRWERLRLRAIGASVCPTSAVRLGLGFVIGSGIAGLHAATLLLAGHVQYKLAAKLDLTAVPIILLGYLMLACREELAFHGYPLRRMDSLFGLYVAQVTIAVVFAAEHILGGYSWANAILGAASGSLLFGMASLATRGLAVPIGLHAAWNLGQWVLGSKETPGFYAPVVEEGFRGSFECTSMISYLGIIVIATFLFWAWNRRTVRSAG